ncbi:rho GTPase-activating protein 92B-like [Sabethes cyaneus]|uniref:rho GTPase-activating protein 92B-like n=1 Tax=Sabethes cyaneus TaxID=53552 RepID=UPI00237E3DDB|nr:rho GTPase-activating protein 92B-like [Sabethes cyaneus]XP_053692708.1 rho GTPase-activating protein 92B-like [Sabethes cyaneus]XP_053692709.1 rho GTPase-activating protein 92B-like [Sabethes cyaneus]XP_053692710.1 rho GTPase-activating protein 92B-like [Sabethes cyaneus]XP_053692711.1 rho GTPase-activating protein 92B-like [Sabethes cyaneus]
MSRNMKRQLEKFKEELKSNLTRSSKAEKNADGLQEVEREVDRYKDILQNLNKRIASTVSAGQPQDVATKEKRVRKVAEFQLGQLMEESAKDLPLGLLRDVLDKCARLEKTVASEIINNEMNVENSVSKNLNDIIERHLATIQKQKRIVGKCHQEYEATRQKYDSAQRNSDQFGNQTKLTQLKDDLEELHNKLEKERDLYESYMYELLAEEENIANYVKEYVKHQELYYTSALREIQSTINSMDGLFRRNNKQIFHTPLREHLKATDRKIAYVIELCVCCLLEKGLYEEGLLRVGCASSKLRRMISAINANYVTPPLADKYADPHVTAGVLKKYLRSLPDPLLTFEFYQDFVIAAQKPSETQRKAAILNIINQLPKENYDNLRYLTKFLSYLSEKNQENKMSPQNIAIVMSPNLLWSPNENENYIDQVNSTATVNTIVEALITDWGFFFDGDVNFYVSMSRDTLFPDNGGFPVDKDHPVRAPANDYMSKSMIATMGSQDEIRYYNSGGGGGGNSGGGGSSSSNSQKPSTSHSRSSSHDTSLILINSNDQLSKHRSQSNSSLSDHSSPPHENSPKPTVRRKHNKQAAPTPPDNHHKGTTTASSNHNTREHNTAKVPSSAATYFKQLNNSSNNKNNGMGRARNDEGFQSLQHHAYKQAQQDYVSERQPIMTRAESHDDLLKLKSPAASGVPGAEKIPPPRPAAVSIGETQTLNRAKGMHDLHHQNSKLPNAPNCDSTSSIGNKENKDSHNRQVCPLPVKPVALPRTTLVAAKTPTPTGPGPNGHGAEDDNGFMTVVREKPVIPERPAILLRPQSFKGSIPEISKVSEGTNTLISSTNSLKKAQSFRGETSSGAGKEAGSTVLERTQIYNIDKQQVAIIDVAEKHSSGEEKTKKDKTVPISLAPVATVPEGIPPLAMMESTGSLGSDFQSPTNPVGPAEANSEATTVDAAGSSSSATSSTAAASSTTTTTTTTTSLQHVPQSPRGFDQAKIKRPQVPAPPPPVGRPKSSDSTDL